MQGTETIVLETDELDMELQAIYSITGNYYPATLEEPAEYPDLELLSLSRLVEGKQVDVSEMLTGEEWGQAIDLVWEAIND